MMERLSLVAGLRGRYRRASYQTRRQIVIPRRDDHEPTTFRIAIARSLSLPLFPRSRALFLPVRQPAVVLRPSVSPCRLFHEFDDDFAEEPATRTTSSRLLPQLLFFLALLRRDRASTSCGNSLRFYVVVLATITTTTLSRARGVLHASHVAYRAQGRGLAPSLARSAGSRGTPDSSLRVVFAPARSRRSRE